MAAHRRYAKRLYRFQVSFLANAKAESGAGRTRRDDPVRRRLRRAGAGGKRKGKFVSGGDQAPFCRVRKKLGCVVGRYSESDAATCRTIGRSPALLAATFIHLRNSLRLPLSCSFKCLAGVSDR